MSDAIIKTEDLVFRYTTEEGVAPTVLDGVDLTIREGSFVAILGHNGSGKSTLIQHLNGLLKPTSGQVLFDGQDIWENKARTRMRSLHYQGMDWVTMALFMALCVVIGVLGLRLGL